MVEGQINLRDAIRGTINFTNPEGKEYTLNERVAVLMPRPRGWHLLEKHGEWLGLSELGTLETTLGVELL